MVQSAQPTDQVMILKFLPIACVQPIYKTIIINATLMHLNEEKKIV